VAAPERGQLVWITFTPHAGREQGGRWPALVLTSRAYHQISPYTVACPITSKVRGWGFEVLLPPNLPVSGVILVDQIKNVDRHARKIEPIGHVPEEVLEEVLAKLKALLQL
jgi:mRNA interferase MazF